MLALFVFSQSGSSPRPTAVTLPLPDARATMLGGLETLKGMAAELRKSQPELSESQAFLKVYADPANKELAAAERRENRPAS
jgi:hypothetical protein